MEDLQAAYRKIIISCYQNNPMKQKLLKILYVTFNTGVTDPSFKVKMSEIESDWEVSPCFRKAAPCSSRSLAILSYNLDLLSVFKFSESEINPFYFSTKSAYISAQNQIFNNTHIKANIFTFILTRRKHFTYYYYIRPKQNHYKAL